MVSEQGIAGGSQLMDASTEVVFHDPVLVKGDSGGRSATVDAPGRYRARVFLSPPPTCVVCPGMMSARQLRFPLREAKPMFPYSINQAVRLAGGSSLSFWKTSPNELIACS